MIKLNSLLFTLFFVALFSKTDGQVLDSFKYEGEPDSTIWLGDLSEFQVKNEALWSKSNKANSQFFIGTFDSTEPAYGHLDIDLNFKTSSKNYVDVVLCADSIPSKNSLFIRLGGSKDALEIFEKSNSNLESRGRYFVGSTENLHTDLQWELDTQGMHVNYLDSSILISELHCRMDSAYTGISISQSTSSFFFKHQFRDIYWGPKPIDTFSPHITNLELPSERILNLQWSEDMDTTISGYATYRGNEMKSHAWLGLRQLSIHSSDAWSSNEDNTIEFGDWRDANGNVMRDTLVSIRYIRKEKPQIHELLINELLIDPEPVVSLPKMEYIELYNRSYKHLDLSSCLLTDSKSTAVLPNRIIPPNSYLVLASEKQRDESLDTQYTWLSEFPTLNNDEDEIRLICDSQEVHYLAYDAAYLSDGVKGDGGWSLEMIDPTNPCGDYLNWTYSLDWSGGTPGRHNSVFGSQPDNNQPKVLFAGLSRNEVRLRFSEDIQNRISIPDSFILQSSELFPMHVSWPTRDELLLEYEYNFEQGWEGYLMLPRLYDCIGFTLDSQKVYLVKPSRPKTGDVLINEILFNPMEGSEEFIELYHNGKFTLDLNDLQLASKEDDQWKNAYPLVGNSTLLFPGEYTVLCKSAEPILYIYPHADSTRFVEVPHWPSLPNDEGRIFLVGRALNIIDEVEYKSTDHFDLISETKGVSLERVSQNNPSTTSDIWASCSEYYRATPGLKNSQHLEHRSQDFLSLLRETFSPNNDGFHDRLAISVHPEEPEFSIRLTIYDLNGFQVVELCPRRVFGSQETLYWDGISEAGKLVAPGLYILMLEGFTDSGRIVREKLAFSVVY